ncbi:MAG: hypothetical protein ACW99G_18165 [Candidatus Thorarchaeota archaeon]|jgi:predicted O-methyltransferase YrrM
MKEIEARYQEYTTKYSPAKMAVSLELAKYLMEIAVSLQPPSILDLGSGFSSWVFREYQNKHNPLCFVTSVDDQELYLERSKEFVESQNLPGISFMKLCDFISSPLPRYDLIFYDLGHMRMRIKYMHLPFQCASNGSVIIVDDMHKRHFASLIQSYGAGFRWRKINESVDMFGRFGYRVDLR